MSESVLFVGKFSAASTWTWTIGIWISILDPHLLPFKLPFQLDSYKGLKALFLGRINGLNLKLKLTSWLWSIWKSWWSFWKCNLSQMFIMLSANPVCYAHLGMRLKHVGQDVPKKLFLLHQLPLANHNSRKFWLQVERRWSHFGFSSFHCLNQFWSGIPIKRYCFGSAIS